MYVFHRFLVLALIRFGFAALVCKIPKPTIDPNTAAESSANGNTSPVWGMTGIGAGVAVGVLAGAGAGTGVLFGVGVLLGVSSCGVSSGMRASFITTV